MHRITIIAPPSEHKDPLLPIAKCVWLFCVVAYFLFLGVICG